MARRNKAAAEKQILAANGKPQSATNQTRSPEAPKPELPILYPAPRRQNRSRVWPDDHWECESGPFDLGILLKLLESSKRTCML